MDPQRAPSSSNFFNLHCCFFLSKALQCSIKKQELGTLAWARNLRYFNFPDTGSLAWARFSRSSENLIAYPGFLSLKSLAWVRPSRSSENLAVCPPPSGLLPNFKEDKFGVLQHHCFFSVKRSSCPVGLLPPCGIAPSRFRPLWKKHHCCLPLESGPCLSPSVADHPLGPTTDHSLDASTSFGGFLVFSSAYMPFPAVVPLPRACSNALITLPPLKTPLLVRLSCVRHAVSVHPES
ncbi:hypothetical protein Lal_00001013 [Lupinus albus]|nr:hypothetical protein Lal_00001013 [Lupinus albus]